MASFGSKQEIILQTLRAARKATPLCVPTFQAYLDLMALTINASESEYKRFVKSLEPGSVLPGLQRATSQLHRYAYPPPPAALQQQVHQQFHQQGGAASDEASHKGHSYFLERVVPFLLDRALEWPQLFPDGKLPLAQFNPKTEKFAGREETQIELTRRQILTIHALCFLGCDPAFEKPRHDVGNLSWWTLFFTGSSRVGVERILCQLIYFEYWRDRFENNANRPSSSLSGEKHEAEADEESKKHAKCSSSPSSSTSASFVPNIDDKVSFARIAFPEITTVQALGAANNNNFVDNRSNNKNQKLPDWRSSHLASSPLHQVRVLELPPSTSSSSARYGKDISSGGIHIEGKFMEDFDEAHAHVDFANEQLMIGRLIPSMTQEEVMFSVRPELLISLLLFDTLRCREAVIMKNAVRYMNYKGYRDTFTVNRAVPELLPSSSLVASSSLSPSSAASLPLKTHPHQLAPEVIAIDAHVNTFGSKRQFAAEMNERDLDKCFIGFSSTTNKEQGGKGEHGENEQQEHDIIATGPLGCGVFNGDRFLKALQQMMAAACCSPRRYLCYYEQTPAPLRVVARLLLAKEISVATAYQWIDEYSTTEGRSRSQTSSDAAPPIQLGLKKAAGEENNDGDHHHNGSSDDSSLTVEEMEQQGRALKLDPDTFGAFLMRKVVEAQPRCK